MNLELITLKMKFLDKRPCFLKCAAFVDAFGELTELVVLKLTNFGVNTLLILDQISY